MKKTKASDSVDPQHMVRIGEDAYLLNNLSHFTIECEHYCGPRKQICGENCHPWFIAISGQ